jgi:hypothetical protein
MKCLGYERITVDVTVKTASNLAIPADTTVAEIQAEGDNIHYTLDGTSVPGSSSGMLLPANGEPKEIQIENLLNIKFTQDAGSPFLNVHYFGRAI